MAGHDASEYAIKSSGAEINIPITPALDAVLARARSLAKIKPGPGGDAFVVQSRKGGPYTAFGIRSAIDRAAIRAGYASKDSPRSGLTAKDLRAFAASCAKAQGYTLEQLKAGSEDIGSYLLRGSNYLIIGRGEMIRTLDPLHPMQIRT